MSAEKNSSKGGLYPPEIIFSPGEKYHTLSRKWQGIPSIEIADNGRLWASWYSGGDGEGPGNFVLLTTRAKEEKKWSEPVVVIDPGERRRAFDPCLWHDPSGRMCLFWAQSGDNAYYDGRGGVWMISAEPFSSRNASPVWTDCRRIFHGVMLNKPTVLSSGEWLLPVAIWKLKGAPLWENLKPYYGCGIVVSNDNGKTYSWRGAAKDIPHLTFPEHMVVELKDGALLMFIRTKYGIARSKSFDIGKTWSKGELIIEGPDSRFFIRRLRSGRILLVYHFGTKERSHLTAKISEDEGKTWKGGLLLDKRKKVSYPDGIETSEGLIHIIYDFNRGNIWSEGKDREILMATFTEEDVLAGKCVSRFSSLRQVINKISS